MTSMKKIISTVSMLAWCTVNTKAGESILRQVNSGLDPQIGEPRQLQSKALVLVGDPNGSGPVLGECEGDCDSDRECGSGLRCFQRSGSETVPGCTGDKREWRGRDFCVKSSNGGGGGGGSGSGGSSFRIKMWWQPGYDWQEESFERKWCLQCRNSCNVGVEIAIRECSSGNTKFEFVGSSSVQVKVSGKDLCMELMSSDNRKITLQKCSSSSRQKFTAGLGSFSGEKFELQTVAVSGCVTQEHHPRDGELIRRQGCDGARFDTTSFYNKY
jgi:hypothetical protein